MPSPEDQRSAIRIFIADPHPIFRIGLSRLLSEIPGFVVSGSTSHSEEAVMLVRTLQPHVVITDFFFPAEPSGVNLIRALTGIRPKPRVLVMSGFSEAEIGERSVRAGARGFLNKFSELETTVIAIRDLVSGRYALSETMLGLLMDKLADDTTNPFPLTGTLSEREIQIFHLIGSGLAPAIIGARLGISPRTVTTHRETIKRKLNATSVDHLKKIAEAWLKETHFIKNAR